MNILLIETLACLIAAAFLSLFIGWVVRGAIAKKEVMAIDSSWQDKLSELQLRHKQDTEHLEDQVDRLDSESNQLAHRNDNISQSLRENELSVHKARADAIELNRKQANTQERLQRIIAQKDEELRLLRENAAKAKNVKAKESGAGKSGKAKAGSTRTRVSKSGVARTGATGTTTLATVSAESTEAKIASLSAKRVAWEAERQRLIKTMGDQQETIAIDPADLPTEPFDKTVRINQEQAVSLKKRKAKRREPSDVETDITQMIDVDQTIVLDEPNINGPKRTAKKPRNPGNKTKK